MKPLSPQERVLLERTVSGDTWMANAEELRTAIELHRLGLLDCVNLSEQKGSPWFSYPPVSASFVALRIDQAYRRTL